MFPRTCLPILLHIGPSYPDRIQGLLGPRYGIIDRNRPVRLAISKTNNAHGCLNLSPLANSTPAPLQALFVPLAQRLRFFSRIDGQDKIGV